MMLAIWRTMNSMKMSAPDCCSRYRLPGSDRHSRPARPGGAVAARSSPSSTWIIPAPSGVASALMSAWRAWSLTRSPSLTWLLVVRDKGRERAHIRLGDQGVVARVDVRRRDAELDLQREFLDRVEALRVGFLVDRGDDGT